MPLSPGSQLGLTPPTEPSALLNGLRRDLYACGLFVGTEPPLGYGRWGGVGGDEGRRKGKKEGENGKEGEVGKEGEGEIGRSEGRREGRGKGLKKNGTL